MSALARVLILLSNPPATKTRPSARRVAVWPERCVDMFPADAHWLAAVISNEEVSACTVPDVPEDDGCRLIEKVRLPTSGLEAAASLRAAAAALTASESPNNLARLIQRRFCAAAGTAIGRIIAFTSSARSTKPIRPCSLD